MKTITKTLLLGACALAIFATAGCDKSDDSTAGTAQAAAAQKQMFPAHVFDVQYTDREMIQELPGRVDAVRSADVCARVPGVLLERRFEEGAKVEKGQSLFLIDPAELQASKMSAEANVAAAKASLASAEITFARFQKVIDKGGVSQQDYDTAKIAVDAAKASVMQAEAALRSVEIQLGYTEVVAPITGIIGAAFVTEGALVGQAGVTQLAVIQQMDPINFDFSQSATAQLELRAAIKEGRVEANSGEMEVELLLEDGSVYPYKGKMKFSEVTIDKTTGMYKLRAEFPNPENVLLPGMFARARICEGVDKKAIIVPQEALTIGAGGKATAFVLNPDNTVKVAQLRVGEMLGNKYTVLSGLNPGDKLVTDGIIQIGMMLRKGPVTVIAQPYAGAPVSAEKSVPANENAIGGETSSSPVEASDASKGDKTSPLQESVPAEENSVPAGE